MNKLMYRFLATRKKKKKKIPAILALRVMLGLIHLFQLCPLPIDKTILAIGTLYVTTIALRCFPCVTRLRLSPQILASHADVLRAGTRDEPLRTSACRRLRKFVKFPLR